MASSFIRHFCVFCVALTLGFPLARFYTWSLRCDLSRATARFADEFNPMAGLLRQSLWDLQYWRSLKRGEGRDLQPPQQQLTMHTDAVDVCYRGTLGPNPLQGSPGLWSNQVLWDSAERKVSITLRELRAVRLLSARPFFPQICVRSSCASAHFSATTSRW